MKMTRKSIIGIVIMALCVSGLQAQSIDEKRMDRDLKVAENILNTLASGDSRLRFHNNIESNYLPDFGDYHVANEIAQVTQNATTNHTPPAEA